MSDRSWSTGLQCDWSDWIRPGVGHGHNKDPASLWVEHLGCQLGLECMENEDYPVDSLGTVLWTQGQDSGDSEGLASIGAGFHGPGPVKWMGAKVVEHRAWDSRGGKLSSEGAFGEGMVALSDL